MGLGVKLSCKQKNRKIHHVIFDTFIKFAMIKPAHKYILLTRKQSSTYYSIIPTHSFSIYNKLNNISKYCATVIETLLH